jgi:hypothetical protein
MPLNVMEQPPRFFAEGGAFLNMVFLTTRIHASNRQIWYRHPNSEAGNDEIQNDKIFKKFSYNFKILIIV